jgi:hypothetical protein
METQKSNTEQFITTYHLGGNLCIRRVGPSDTVEVLIPERGQTLPLSHQKSTYPDQERLEKYLASFESVTQEKYEEYLLRFYEAAERNHGLYKELLAKRTPAGS